MLRLAWHVTIMAMAMMALNGCGWPDAYSVFPDSIRLPRRETRLPDPRPDAARLIGDNIGSIFTKEARARNVMISEPRRDPASFGWTVCVKANVASIAGKPIGVQTFLIFIDEGKIGLRRPAEPKDECQAEHYERLNVVASPS